MKELDFYIQNEIYRDDETHEEKTRRAFDFFMSTLRESIYTWDYFVDFQKVNRNSLKLRESLEDLNALLGYDPDEIDDKLVDLIRKNKYIKNALPLLIACRKKKFRKLKIIDDLDTMELSNKSSLFDLRKKLTGDMEKEMLVFFKKSGLKDFFINNEINDLVDFYKGIEVGLDTNARKNRTGKLMETILEELVESYIDENGGELMTQATSASIKKHWGIEIISDKTKRRYDVAYLSSAGKLSLIETNYYSGGGSKLKATAGEYKTLNGFLKKQDINFIWVTDGLGWNTASSPLLETFILIDYTINLEMIKRGIFKEIL